MRYNELEKYVKFAYSIGRYRSEIASYVDAAKKCQQVATDETIAIEVNGRQYSMEYEPAVEPVKNMYEEYIRVFNCAVEYIDLFINALMKDLTKSILYPDDTQSTDIMSYAINVSKNCEATKDYARDILEAMKKILEITVVGIVEKKPLTATPFEMAKYFKDNDETKGLYDPSTGIQNGFQELDNSLKDFETSLKGLFTDVSAFNKVQSEANLDIIIESLKDVYNNIVRPGNYKKSKSYTLSEILKTANGLMSELKDKIAAEMKKRMAPISAAFDRIDPTVPKPQSDVIISIKPKGNSLSPCRLSFDEMLRVTEGKSVVTLTLSSACAVQDDRKDCRGQFKLSVLKEKHVVSSDAEVLFIVDDGYSAIKLSDGVRIDTNDFDKDAEVYFSESAFEKLETIIMKK